MNAIDRLTSVTSFPFLLSTFVLSFLILIALLIAFTHAPFYRWLKHHLAEGRGMALFLAAVGLLFLSSFFAEPLAPSPEPAALAEISALQRQVDAAHEKIAELHSEVARSLMVAEHAELKAEAREGEIAALLREITRPEYDLKDITQHEYDVATEIDLLRNKVRDLEQELAEQHDTMNENAAVTLVRLSKHPGLVLTLGYGNLKSIAHERGDNLELAEHYYNSLISDVALKMEAFAPGVAVAYENLSTVHRLIGNIDEAQKYHEDAVELARAAGGPVSEVISTYDLIDLGWILPANLRAAESYHLEARDLAETLDYEWGKASANLDLGVVAYVESEFETAEAYFEEALAIFQQNGYELGEAMTLVNLAALYKRLSRHDRVRETRDKVEDVLRELEK